MLYKRRLDKRLTLADVAAKIGFGVHLSQVSVWLRGAGHQMQTHSLIRVANALDMDVFLVPRINSTDEENRPAEKEKGPGAQPLDKGDTEA